MPLLVLAGLWPALPFCPCVELSRGAVEEPLAGVICLCVFVPEDADSWLATAVAGAVVKARAAAAAAMTVVAARRAMRRDDGPVIHPPGRNEPFCESLPSFTPE